MCKEYIWENLADENRLSRWQLLMGTTECIKSSHCFVVCWYQTARIKTGYLYYILTIAYVGLKQQIDTIGMVLTESIMKFTDFLNKSDWSESISIEMLLLTLRLHSL